MKICSVRLWRLTPPRDTWIIAELKTDSGLTGWGELTNSGHDEGAAAIFSQSARLLVGKDPLRINEHLAHYRDFTMPPRIDKILVVAWSGVAQALWDIKAKVYDLPLYKLLGADGEVSVPLYANLNRGLWNDRSPAGHAKHAEAALKAGFAAAKCAPLDDITPTVLDPLRLTPAMERMRAAVNSVGASNVAIDCHQRLASPMAHQLLEQLTKLGTLFWVEDPFTPEHMDKFALLHATYPGVTWAGGEETFSLNGALKFLSTPHRPDVFMPDVKFICGLDHLLAMCFAAQALGCRVSPHNPQGPVSQAFAAHVAAACSSTLVEYPFLAVPTREHLTDPIEPVENGRYVLGDRLGIGIELTKDCLEKYGSLLCDISE